MRAVIIENLPTVSITCLIGKELNQKCSDLNILNLVTKIARAV
jgi:hypothetical protein